MHRGLVGFMEECDKLVSRARVYLMSLAALGIPFEEIITDLKTLNKTEGQLVATDIVMYLRKEYEIVFVAKENWEKKDGGK